MRCKKRVKIFYSLRVFLDFSAASREQHACTLTLLRSHKIALIGTAAPITDLLISNCCEWRYELRDCQNVTVTSLEQFPVSASHPLSPSNSGAVGSEGIGLALF